jgi:hypothetical protein
MAAELFVVNFESGHRTAQLAFPAIATKYYLAKIFVRDQFQPSRSFFEVSVFHAACSRKLCRNRCCCSPGRNW